jgi:muramoyltetrapeptide carboxypeptidase
VIRYLLKFFIVLKMNRYHLLKLHKYNVYSRRSSSESDGFNSEIYKNSMGKKKLIPPYLKPGDEVAIVSPSWAIDEDKIENAVRFLENWRLKVRPGRNVLKRSGPFAGDDNERLDDLQEMTDNPEIKAVFCSRGGYGMIRIIDRLDFSALKASPKWYIGFSDITVLHLWLSEVTGIASIHGEMPLNFDDKDKTAESFESLHDALFGNYREIRWEGSSLRPHKVTGEITGGNLSLLYSLIGTRSEPETKGKILFIEDVGEYFYHLDRMLESLRLAGKLDGLSALIAGGMTKMEDTRIPWGKTAEETIGRVASECGFPVFFNFPAGHINDNRAFYIGRRATVKTEGNSFILTYT